MRITELDALLRRAWFRAYSYAQEELVIAATLSADRATEFLAGRFAGKEAVVKVIGTGFAAGVRPCQVAILRSESGALVVRLSGRAARCAAAQNITHISVSITHKAGLVLAAAIGVVG
jgi:holo-[acyl-carrier protein] synthase